MILTTDVPKMSDNQLKGTLKDISELLNAIVLEQEKRENEGGKQPPSNIKTFIMKTLIIENTKIGSIETEVIMLHDQENKRSSYVYTNEPNHKDWVVTQANAYRANGYVIWNESEVKL